MIAYCLLSRTKLVCLQARRTLASIDIETSASTRGVLLTNPTGIGSHRNDPVACLRLLTHADMPSVPPQRLSQGCAFCNVTTLERARCFP